MCLHCTATTLTTRFQKVVQEVNQLEVPWTRPQFQTYFYKQVTFCRLLCDHKTYYINEAMLNGAVTLIKLYGLRPGSVCLIRLLAVYNSASIDPGLQILACTLYSSKC